MDVRCERCQTEYELDDKSVSELGTQVQCTSCGHTFQVRRRPVSEKVQPTGAGEGPAPAQWMLKTADGQIHRFRNLAALHKWIIERKAMREDRISKNGALWHRLGDLAELKPFFDVVDEADRAKAAAALDPAADLSAQAEAARRSSPRFTPPRGNAGSVAGVNAGPPVGDKPWTGRPTPDRASPSASRSSEIRPVEAPGWSDDLGVDTAVVRMRGGGWKVLMSVVVAAAVAFIGIKQLPEIENRLARQAAAEPGTGTDLAREGAAAPLETGSVALAQTGASNPGADPAAGNAAAGTAAGLVGAGTPEDSQAAGTPAPGSPPVAAPPMGSPSGTGSVAAAAGDPPVSGTQAAVTTPAPRTLPAGGVPTGGPASRRPKTMDVAASDYDALVAGASTLLRSGAAFRALKMYQRALRARPDGAEALAGIGFVNLGQRRFRLAVTYFQRALTSAPYAPAMYGLGEAHRHAGESEAALDAYRRYLVVSPNGNDASAARQHIRDLGANGAKDEVAEPASILREGAL